MKTLVLIVLLGLVSLSSGLKCRKCGDDGVCDGPDDNGKPYECQGSEDTCFYREFKMGRSVDVVRDCIPAHGTEYCYRDIDMDYQIDSTTCLCTGDNCNAGNRCDCEPQYY